MSQTYIEWEPQPSRFASKAESDAMALTYADAIASMPGWEDLAAAIREDPKQGCFDCAYNEVDNALVPCKWHWEY